MGLSVANNSGNALAIASFAAQSLRYPVCGLLDPEPDRDHGAASLQLGPRAQLIFSRCNRYVNQTAPIAPSA